MKVNIEITEGCTNFSYLINDKEWVDYIIHEENNMNYTSVQQKELDFLNNVCEKLIDEAVEQYNIPQWMIEYLWNGEYDTYCTQDTFIKLVKNNKNVKEEFLGICDECGDSIYRWKLEIKIKN